MFQGYLRDSDHATLNLKVYFKKTSTVPFYFLNYEKKSYYTLSCRICRELLESDENIKISVKDKNIIS